MMLIARNASENFGEKGDMFFEIYSIFYTIKISFCFAKRQTVAYLKPKHMTIYYQVQRFMYYHTTKKESLRKKFQFVLFEISIYK